MKRSAFTLIELLVVIGIIALLAGLLAPVLRHARVAAQATKCRAHLKSIGTGWALYADQYPESMPAVKNQPSPIDSAPPGEVTMLTLLRPYVAEPAVFGCPSDDRDYFGRLGTSYEYLPGLAIAFNPQNAAFLAGIAQRQPEIIPIMTDAERFHPAPDDLPNPRLTVYYDAHVDWLWKDVPRIEDAPPTP